MRVLLTGASGFLGSRIAQAAADAGHDIVAISRRHGVDMGRMGTPASWRPLLEGVHAVINAVGIIGETRGQTFRALHTESPIALFEACAQAGMRRVVQISALGADAQACSAYHLSKRAADDALRRLDLDGFVLRPSLIHGQGGASARLLCRLAALPVIPVVGDGRQRIQPVHVDDVVATVLRCLTAEPPGLTLDVVGPHALDLADWLQRLRAAQGLPPAPLWRVPQAAAMALAVLGHGFSPMLRRDNLRMLRAGNTADARPLMQFLGRALQDPAQDVRPPVSPSARHSA